LLTKDRYIQEKTFHILNSYRTNIRRSYRISTKMPTEWPKMAEWPSGVTRRMLNNRVHLDLWYAVPPMQGGHRHGEFTVH
jgi:hypothetical protein